MGSVPSELSLDFRPKFMPKTISNFLEEISLMGSVSDKISKLDSFVKRLEEEMRKIDGFKRELPLSMLLLNDAILALKEESTQCVRRRNVEPVLEGFIPLKNNQKENNNHSDEEEEDDSKKNWMSSVQLWNTDDDDYSSIDDKLDTKRNHGDPFKNRGKVRGFMPFKANLSFAVKKEEKREIPIHGLTILTPGIKNPKVELGFTESRMSRSRAASCSSLKGQVNFRSELQPLSDHQRQQQQATRKQRRCWSSELHRRFVNALQQLGGSQVATPKQIRELMQVDGLTNDEVKSHLQKYRLHTRRLPPSTRTTTTPANQSALVLGNGLCMSHDPYGDSSKGSSSQSGSPQGPLQLATNTGGTSTTRGDSTEDEEDAKSKAYSWKTPTHKPLKGNV
ncbi:hypothetical protein ES332_D04G198800v1 [Gossypium tomentosum]|uniref:HTH myb-type domain-containing protein n=1 Tax=Gossypium tomentosum TaxID=34277 RepID=A0A5D2LGF2_GOSTO|nr:hypothetical protein ES332_D04G198800v1 [Gossypium tomentosum]